MFSGEPEVQARRRTLAILQDEARRVLDSARELSICYKVLVEGDLEKQKDTLAKILKAEDDIENLRRVLTKEVAETGPMMLNREDLLRAAFEMETVAGYITGISFRLSQIRVKVLKKAQLEDLMRKLVDLAVEAVQRLNEVVRVVSINPSGALDMSTSVQKIERQMDEQYRMTEMKIMDGVDSVRDLILLKDIVDSLENMTDRCMTASDSVVILGMSL